MPLLTHFQQHFYHPVTSGFPTQRGSNAESVSMSWHHHAAICVLEKGHYDDVKMDAMASQITSLTIIYSTVYSGADQSKHQSSASLAFVWGIHREPVNSPQKWPVTRKMFPFDDVIRVAYHMTPLGKSVGYLSLLMVLHPKLYPMVLYPKNNVWFYLVILIPRLNTFPL